MFEAVKRLFGRQEKGERALASPLNGRAIAMSQVRDPIFSQEILGPGTAILPSDGEVVAPADGTVTMVLDTRHALSMRTDLGAEIMIHIGLDTVQLKGNYFSSCVKNGDHVKKGSPLLSFDLKSVKAAGYDVTTPVVVTNSHDFPKIDCRSGMETKAGETVIIRY